MYETADGKEALCYLIRRHQEGDTVGKDYVIANKNIKVLKGDEWWVNQSEQMDHSV